MRHTLQKNFHYSQTSVQFLSARMNFAMLLMRCSSKCNLFESFSICVYVVIMRYIASIRITFSVSAFNTYSWKWNAFYATSKRINWRIFPSTTDIHHFIVMVCGIRIFNSYHLILCKCYVKYAMELTNEKETWIMKKNYI